ncbi:MAG: RNA polymerase sigma factor [Planctomycetes bacterium]|nr:RNA polymerase sigma factor [Planctomycetota bacterium]
MRDDDALIMRRVQAGDTEQFGVLIRRYRRALLRLAHSRLGDPEWAEDVVQEAFMAAFAGRASYDPSFSFRTWLWTILINLCKRHWKRRATRPAQQAWSELVRADERCSSEPATETTGLTCVLQAERIERVRELLAELPEEQADALRLRFFGELTFPEIAAALNCCLNTAKSRVRYGLEKIAHTLRREEEIP